MDGSSVYGFIKGASGDPAKQATIRSYLSLYELLATRSIFDEDGIFQFANSSLLAIRKRPRNYCLP